MRLTSSQMYARMLASDATCDGRFFTGVLTTGIYCLPSCRARKPRPENVRFFPSCEAARAFGLRPCKKCHPDDYARGADPVLEDVETLVGAVRRQPDTFADARAVVRRSGFGATRLFELFRQHYQQTPADLLLEARLEAAQQSLLAAPHAPRAGDDSIAAIAYAAGFQSVSVFHEHFRSRTGLTPANYRRLPQDGSFQMQLPAGYALPYLRRALGRDSQSVSERLNGDEYRCIVQLETGPVSLLLRLQTNTVLVQVLEVPSGRQPPPPTMVEAHEAVGRLLGLKDDTEGLARLAHKLGLARLVAGRAGLRLSRTPNVFDAVVWSIVGQQVNLGFAYLLRRRLTEAVGQRLADGWYAPPTAAAVAALEPADLLSRQFSRQKAEYLIGCARLIATGQLPLQAMRSQSATRVERQLQAVRGLGPWSVNYIMMRGFGFPDCAPIGDTGLTSGLQALFELDERPDADATRRLMSVFSPYRSLATAHLWQLKQPPP